MGAAAEILEPCVKRCTDTQRLNEIANHPDIRPTCGGDGKSYLDLAPFVANPLNRAMLWDHGAFLFQWSAPQTYEVHIMVEPEGRGRDAYRMAARGIDYICSQGAERLWARVAQNANALRHYTAQAGFAKCGAQTLDIGFGPVTYDLFQWKKKCPQQS
jgi:hypothetical protein